MPLSDPEDSPSTAIVFCDASSRPYYSFSGEWTMGMDWVLEELVIAAERKPVIQKILQSLDRQPGKIRISASSDNCSCPCLTE